MQLRPIQIDPVKIGVDILTSKFKRRELIVAPCGFGKSLIISHIALNLPKDGNILVTQPSAELLNQNLAKYEMYGNKASVYSGGQNRKEFGRVIYATSKSLNEEFFKQADIKYVILDEADIETKNGTSLNSLLKNYNVVGLTATPLHYEVNGYGSFIKIQTTTKNALFKNIAHVVQMKTMVDLGYWSDIRYEGVKKKFNRDLLELNSTGREFTDTVLIKEFEKNDLFNEVVKIIKNIPKTESILVFIPSVDYFEKLIEDVPNSTLVSSKTPKKERDRRVKQFLEGDIQVMFNTGILTTGFDYPNLRNIIDALPTNSFRTHMQKVLRGVRICNEKNKTHCSIYDLSGNSDKFGTDLSTYTIEEISKYGWALLKNNVLMSDVPIQSKRVITKQDIINNNGKVPSRLEKEELEFVITLGKYKGKKLSQVIYKDARYLKWMYENKVGGEKLVKILTKLFY